MVRIRKWKTKDGRTREIRLAKAWKNIKRRVRQEGSYWYGLPIHFTSWQEFRAWSISSGYGKNGRVSLDRIDNTQGYSPDNCRWVTKADNIRHAKPWAYRKTHKKTPNPKDIREGV